MSESAIIDSIVEVIFQCSCGDVLSFIERDQVIRCRGCDTVYSLKLEILEDGESGNLTIISD